MHGTYEPTWSSLRNHPTPAWLREKKFGIYTHWGVYSVPACGPNGTWYAHNMYREGNSQYEYHARTYGPASEFGYKDFIPMFTAEKFDADEWAELFKASGAAFAGPVAEHPRYEGLYGPMHNLDGLEKGGISRERMREWFWIGLSLKMALR